MAGCTDQLYIDKTCPVKLRFKDQEWVGMTHCGTDANGDTDWGGCKVDPANATDLFKLPIDSCNDYCATTLWVGTADIPSFAVLPTSTGGSISWISGFNPTSTSRAPGTPGTATATTTPSSQISNNSLSTGAKAGIGAGCGVAGLFILGLFLWCCLTRQRKLKAQADVQQQQAQIFAQAPYPPRYNPSSVGTAHSPMTMAALPTGWDPNGQHMPQSKPPGWVAGPTQNAFAGYKNELPADEIRPQQMASPSLREASTTPSSPGRDIGVAVSEASGTMLSRDPRQEVAGGWYLSPHSTGSGSQQQVDEEEHRYRKPPSEMEG